MLRRCSDCLDARIQKAESVWAIHEMYPVINMVRNKINDAPIPMRAMAMTSVSVRARKGEFDPDTSVIKEIKLEGSQDVISCSSPEGCRGAPQCVKVCDVRALTYAEEGVGG